MPIVFGRAAVRHPLQEGMLDGAHVGLIRQSAALYRDTVFSAEEFDALENSAMARHLPTVA